MSDQDGSTRDRATVALAVEKIISLTNITEKEFTDVNRRLDKLEGLPDRVTRLETQQAIVDQLHVSDRVGGLEKVTADHEHRLLGAERERNEIRASRAVHWPTLILGLLALVVAIAAPIIFN